ncbi:hypothetical protein TNCV_4032201 [Trichonephila clavipes]|nr:hypothetical protein TNCV_4032201 [Trichonephila clavipes]
MLLNANGRELGQCPFCNQTTCHRWIAVQGMCAILHQPINPIFHSGLATDNSTHILLERIKEDASRRFVSVDASL